MDNKLLLISLIEKYREIIYNTHEYRVCNQLLTKIVSAMITNDAGSVQVDFSMLLDLTEEEVSMFSNPQSKRILDAFKVLDKKDGWRLETVLRHIKSLHQDILDNKLKEYKSKIESLDEVFKIIDEDKIADNYSLILDFIKMGVENRDISFKDAFNLNFYVLNECNGYKNTYNENEDEVEIVELDEVTTSVDDRRLKIKDIFNKYGYVYDEVKMGEYDDKLVKYVNIDYLDYVLSKFKEYNITLKELYLRKIAFCNIVIDNDKSSFDSIIQFMNENECTFSSLLMIPSVFIRRKRNYVSRGKNSTGGSNDICGVVGANKDFLDNITLYKKLAGVEIIKDVDLNNLSKFLCTPSHIVNKNLALLRKYHIISQNQLPKAITALCGNNTEYIIDRLIEAGLYESYLSDRVTPDGKLRQSRGTYLLDRDGNPFRFYKMKRAIDFGQSILAVNGGIKKVFTDNNAHYMGLSLDEEKNVVQEQLPLSTMESVPFEIRKSLPYVTQKSIENGSISTNLIGSICFNKLYKYTTFSPLEIYAASDKSNVTNLRGERLSLIFKNDYSRVISNDEVRGVLHDEFIKLLDNVVYCNSYGESRNLKVTNLYYQFAHPSFPNTNIIVSRYKVLRLCKLLKENGSWINDKSSKIDKENCLLSVIMKDTILSATEVIMLRMAVREILSNGIIRVPNDTFLTLKKRGVR